MTRVALFGGSFNPPHVGHVMVASWLLATGRCEEVWLVPASQHAFGKELAAFDARVEMLRASFRDLARVTICEIEAERAGPSYTIDTVVALRAKHPDVSFRIVVGTDAFADRPKWREWQRLENLAPPIVVRRAGVAGAEDDPDPAHPTPLFPEVSSTRIRAILAGGGDASGLVPAGALEVIRRRALYAG